MRAVADDTSGPLAVITVKHENPTNLLTQPSART
jgi:hypothetical protein